MRRFAAVAGLVLAALPAQASAQEVSMRSDLRVSGRIVVSWQGDPLRGCVFAGLCADRGTIAISPATEGRVELVRVGRAWQARGWSAAVLGQPTVVRTRRDSPGEAPGLCTESLGEAPQLSVEPARGRLSRIGFESREPVSAGRCAGPTAFDLAGVLPSALADLGRLRRGPLTLRLAGRRPLAAGPLSGEARFDVRVRLGRLRPSNDDYYGGATISARPRGVVELRYRVTRLAARTTVGFRGLPELGCDVLDGCGVVGVATQRFETSDARASVEALARPGAPRTRAQLLRDLRSGRLDVHGAIDLPDDALGTATVELLRPSGTSGCRDTALAPNAEVSIESTRDGLNLSTDRYDAESLRARCPGPTRLDVLGTRPAARGRIAPASLLEPRLTLRLRGGGRFAGPAYAGSHATSVEVELVRERLLVHAGRSR